jgi:hypothetical protein
VAQLEVVEVAVRLAHQELLVVMAQAVQLEVVEVVAQLEVVEVVVRLAHRELLE